MGLFTADVFKTIIQSSLCQNALPKRNFMLSSRNQTTKKVSIIKKSFPADRQESPVALETKESSSVIKRLNWEFRQLYGPLQKPKTEYKNNTDYKTLQKNTHYRTENLVITENTDLTFESSQTPLEMVLNFPLVNRQQSNVVTDKSRVESEPSPFVTKVNFLREDLLRRCSGKPPSVSRILEKTMPAESAERLRRWREKMVAELGEEGFAKYHRELLSTGSSLHASINAHLTAPGTELHVEEVNAGHWRSLGSLFPQIRNVRLLEERVQHPFLCYQGIVDCFAEYRDRLVVIDWKTSKKSKTSLSHTFDNPLQIAAYVGALNYDSRLQYLVRNGLIVVAYEGGQPATPLFIDETRMQHYWRQWLQRVHHYWEETTH